MENKAAKTAWGPILQVPLEQLIPQERRVIYDAVAYQLMPAYLQALVNLCRIGFVRKTLLNLMDHTVPGTRGGIFCRKRNVTDKLNDALKLMYQQTRVAKQLWQFGLDPAAIGAFLGQYGWDALEQVGSAEYQQRYLEPVNRIELVMEVERAVRAQRMAN